MIQARVNAGLAGRARKANGYVALRQARRVERRIRELLKGGIGKLKIARQLGIGTSVVQRIAASC